MSSAVGSEQRTGLDVLHEDNFCLVVREPHFPAAAVHLLVISKEKVA